jgi:homocysteine S-methyltransferase
MPLRERLPQLADATFITDGGMETTLIFHCGLDLPHFASFVLLDDEEGLGALRAYFLPYIEIAREAGVGIVLDTPTWRANADWGERLGYTAEGLAELNRGGVRLLERLREEAGGRPQIVICGCVGPRGDGYQIGETMTADEAERYHSAQVEVFADTAADLVSALTMTYAEEAIGIVRAARGAGIPAVVSFTVETDGRLPSGQPLAEAIEHVDEETHGAAAYFMVNCAHPTHFEHALEPRSPPLERIRGLRANASTMSHAELDEAEELDEGDPVDLARRYGDLRRQLPSLNVVGGCCEPTTGTSGRSAASGRPASPDRWVDPAAAPLYNEGRLRLDRRSQDRLRRATATSRRTSGRDEQPTERPRLRRRAEPARADPPQPRAALRLRRGSRRRAGPRARALAAAAARDLGPDDAQAERPRRPREAQG